MLTNSSDPPHNARLGFHYFPDTLHYRQCDLSTWLPELDALGASWLTLQAPLERSIPEFFLHGLLETGIQPILHFHLPTELRPGEQGLDLLFRQYARWGVRYAALYDRPNSRTNWRPAVWAQTDLVERFLDLFLPLAGMALEEGLTPVFPSLEPGGDYWDLSFLRSALRGAKRRGCVSLLDNLALGAYAWAGDRSLDWGGGGAACWPEARPYFTPSGTQDHLGFRIFDWYLEIAGQELGRRPPVLLLGTGICPGDGAPGSIGRGLEHARRNLALARLMAGVGSEDQSLGPVPPEVLACNFWLLSADEGSAHAAQAWFQPGGERLPVVDAFRRWVVESRERDQIIEAELPTQASLVAKPEEPAQADESSHPIDHYVLLPLFAWGAADWDLAAIQPILRDSHPTIGFSLAEARLAAQVTVVGGDGGISDEALNVLRAAGCNVKRLLEDGTLVAT